VNELADPLVAEEMPQLFFSLTSPACIASGRDITRGGASRYWSPVWAIGPATTGNSLHAVERLVFQSKEYTLAEIVAALGDDFQGHERLRQRMRRLPKFGNDDAGVDQRTLDAVAVLYDALDPERNIFGGRFTVGYITLGANVYYGQYVGATPDGRRSGSPLSDGMSPAQGTEWNGPTAALRSVASLDLQRAGSGGILNQKLNPSLLHSVEDVRKFIALNQTYLNDLGGMQVQYNVVSTEALREAQRNPEEYEDLLVRVVGYCARFVALSKAVQNDIIARSEHGAV
jgi:formate C-acetyltransferase